MKLESKFVIDAPDVQVFDNFLDPEILGQCIPGCESLERVDGTHYSGLLVNEVAHVKFRAQFSVVITEMVRPTRVVADMSGEDGRLASSLKVDATLNIAPRDDGASDVHYVMNVILWGKLGRMGESIIRRKTVDIEREFVKRFTAACSTESASMRSIASNEAKLVGQQSGASESPALTIDSEEARAVSSGAVGLELDRLADTHRRAAALSRTSRWRRLTHWIAKKWFKK